MEKVKIGGDTYYLSKLPGECPYCHKSVYPNPLGVNITMECLEIIFKCPNQSCGKAFIGYYDFNSVYQFNHCNIGTVQPVNFSEEIKNISPNFVEIYNEANASEHYNLLQICGVGYRKALEYLIKDYLIGKHEEEEGKIKSKFLGDCIKENISNSNIKIVAERATWLGNDETHYVRLWEGKTIEDLKKLINLTVRWIEMEEITNSIQEDMPNIKRPKAK